MTSNPSACSTDLEQTVDHCDDLGLKGFDHLRRERLLRQLPQPGVVGGIEEQEARGAEWPRLLTLGDRALGHRRLQAVIARRRMAQHLIAVGEGGEHHQIAVARKLQRSALADLVIQRVRIGPVTPDRAAAAIAAGVQRVPT